MRQIAFVAAALVCTLVLHADAHQKQHGQLKIVHPHAMETSSGQTEAVVMMTITNSAGSADSLIGASTPIAELAVVVSGDAKAPQRIELPKDGGVELKATGPHIALKALRKRLIGYDRFPLRLMFEKSGPVDVEVMVEERE
jgi:copper(I)-binding protein